jgi:predicted Zn-dependent peptidase
MTEKAEPDFVNKTVLENGLTILTEKVESVKSVSVGIWAKTGSRNETEQQAGITHFLEHMLFKGTENRSSYDIALSMESVGGYLNAFTSSEYTCYFARCLNSQLERALDVLSDMVLHPSFPEDEIVKEKKVVIEEMKMYRDSPSDYLLEHFTEAIFKDHPLGRPVIGLEKTVSDFERSDLYHYMDDRYQPDNLLVAVAGNMEHDAVIQQVKRFFTGIQLHEGRNYDPSLTPYKRESQKLEKAIEQTHLVLGRRGLSVNHDDRYKLLLMNTLLGGGMSSRLHQHIREKYGYCYTISSFYQTYRDTGIFGIYVGTAKDYVSHVEELIFKELKMLSKEGIPQKELDEAKAHLKGKLLLSLESMSNRMQRLAKSEIYFGRFITLEELIAGIEAVQADEIQEFAADFIDESIFSKAVLIPKEG